MRAPTRLGTWLHRANHARDETSPADALQDYFIILEDMFSRDESSIAEIKHVRDFVSHGDPLTNSALLALVQRELGYKADQYEPRNTDHLRMVRRYRDLARAMVDAEITRLLA